MYSIWPTESSQLSF